MRRTKLFVRICSCIYGCVPSDQLATARMSLNAAALPHLSGVPSFELSKNGTQGSGDKCDIVIYASVVACTAIFVLVLCLLLLLFCWQRARVRRQVRRLVGETASDGYGSLAGSWSLEQSHRHSMRYSSLGTRRPPIFILYALELGTYQRIRREDYPTYTLVMDLTNILFALNLPCYHDGSESFQDDSIHDFSSKVSRAVREAKAVVVMCSEVLSTAFRDAANGRRKAQMKFGKFSVSRVSKTMEVSPDKFVPVTLTGAGSVCSELQGMRYFNLQNHEQFLSACRGSVNSVGVQNGDPQFSEFSELAGKLRQLLSSC